MFAYAPSLSIRPEQVDRDPPGVAHHDMAATSGGHVPAAAMRPPTPADVLASRRPAASGPSALSRAQDVGVAHVGAVGPRLRRHAGLPSGCASSSSIGPSPAGTATPAPVGVNAVRHTFNRLPRNIVHAPTMRTSRCTETAGEDQSINNSDGAILSA